LAFITKELFYLYTSAGIIGQAASRRCDGKRMQLERGLNVRKKW